MGCWMPVLLPDVAQRTYKCALSTDLSGAYASIWPNGIHIYKFSSFFCSLPELGLDPVQHEWVFMVNDNDVNESMK